MNVKSKMKLYTNAKQTRIIEIFSGSARCKDGGFLARTGAKTGAKARIN